MTYLKSPSRKDALCQVWLKLAQWFWRRRFFKNFFKVFSLFRNYLPLGPSFEQTWIPFTQGYFVPSLVEIGPVVLEKKMKMWKVYRQTRTDRQTDGRRKTAHLSFLLWWAKKPNCHSTPDYLYWKYKNIKVYLFKFRYQPDSLKLYEALKHPKLPITKASLSSPWQSYHGGLPEVYTVLPPAWKYLALLAEELVRDLRRARVWGLVGLFTGELGHFISCSSPLPLPLSNTKREERKWIVIYR